MLIAGELVEAASGKRFDNINPATEEVLGEVADAAAVDMQRAIVSSRQAFDDSDWSTNHALRRRCLEQLQAALDSEREEYREELIAEVGTPRMMTFAAQLDWPLEEALLWPAKMIDQFAWERDLPDGNMMGMLRRSPNSASLRMRVKARIRTAVSIARGEGASRCLNSLSYPRSSYFPCFSESLCSGLRSTTNLP